MRSDAKIKEVWWGVPEVGLNAASLKAVKAASQGMWEPKRQKRKKLQS